MAVPAYRVYAPRAAHGRYDAARVVREPRVSSDSDARSMSCRTGALHESEVAAWLTVSTLESRHAPIPMLENDVVVAP